MRAVAIAGLAGLIALTPATVQAQDRGGAAMSTGTAPPPGWSNVPDVGLNPPPRGEGWTPGGWSGDAGGRPGPRADGPPPRRDRMDAGVRGDRRDAAGMAWTGRYNRIGRGSRVPGYLRQPDFVVPDWWSYGLIRPGIGQSWIRYYDDALLIDGRGRVLDSRDAIDWNRDDRRGYPDYGDGGRYEHGNYDRGFHRGDRHGGGVQVWRSGPGAPDVKVHRAGAGSTVVIVQNPSVVTTTTTTYETISSGPRKAKKAWKSKAVRCKC